jgi:hypothetical protein
MINFTQKYFGRNMINVPTQTVSCYFARVGGVNICPGHPYFLVPHDANITSATTAISGTKRFT